MQIVGITRRLATLACLGRRTKLLMVAGVAAAALATPTAALATSGVQCASSSTYGSQCIDVWGSGLQVTDIQTWFTTPNTDYLTNKKWRINLERYNCDPIGKTKSQCPVATTWDGNTRTGNPPKGGSTCTSINFGSTLTIQQCQDYGLAYADGKNRYWSAFYSLPHTFGSNLWLCTELQIYSSTGWHYNAAGLTYGLRACVSVHS